MSASFPTVIDPAGLVDLHGTRRADCGERQRVGGGDARLHVQLELVRQRQPADRFRTGDDRRLLIVERLHHLRAHAERCRVHLLFPSGGTKPSDEESPPCLGRHAERHGLPLRPDVSRAVVEQRLEDFERRVDDRLLLLEKPEGVPYRLRSEVDRSRLLCEPSEPQRPWCVGVVVGDEVQKERAELRDLVSRDVAAPPLQQVRAEGAAFIERLREVVDRVRVAADRAHRRDPRGEVDRTGSLVDVRMQIPQARKKSFAAGVDRLRAYRSSATSRGIHRHDLDPLTTTV